MKLIDCVKVKDIGKGIQMLLVFLNQVVDILFCQMDFFSIQMYCSFYICNTWYHFINIGLVYTELVLRDITNVA